MLNDTMPYASSEKRGLLYIIRLAPKTTFKIGFTESETTLERRMKEAKTWVPSAKLLQTWSCLEKWEHHARYLIASSREPVAKAAALYMNTDRSRDAGAEVVEGLNEAAILERGDSLFSRIFALGKDERDSSADGNVVSL